jgi:hypothetical protein
MAMQLRDPAGGGGTLALVDTFTGAGAATLPPLGASGTGRVAFAGVTTAALPALAAAATSVEAFSGSAIATLPPIGAAAAAAEIFAGQASAELRQLAASSVGTQAFIGVASASLPPIGSSAVGNVVNGLVLGTGTAALPPVGVTVAGALAFVGAATIIWPPLGVTGMGVEAFIGVGVVPLPSMGALGSMQLAVYVAHLATVLIEDAVLTTYTMEDPVSSAAPGNASTNILALTGSLGHALASWGLGGGEVIPYYVAHASSVLIEDAVLKTKIEVE